MAGVHGHIEHFDPEQGEWTSYEQRLNMYFIANEITDADRQKATFLTLIGPKAFHLLKTLCSPTQPASKSFDDLKELLLAHYHPNA